MPITNATTAGAALSSTVLRWPTSSTCPGDSADMTTGTAGSATGDRPSSTPASRPSAGACGLPC
jgi:hypothetical protein